jgi:hypothetical protein
MKINVRWFMYGVIFAAFVWGYGCTNESSARDALEAQGFSDIEFTGYSPTRCSGDDGTCTGFTATGPSGRRVRGAVGCGYACKGCTVRTF